MKKPIPGWDRLSRYGLELEPRRGETLRVAHPFFAADVFQAGKRVAALGRVRFALHQLLRDLAEQSREFAISAGLQFRSCDELAHHSSPLC